MLTRIGSKVNRRSIREKLLLFSLLALLAFLVIIYFVSVILAPEAFTNVQSLIYLLPMVLLDLFALFSFFYPIIDEILKENRIYAQSEQTLANETSNAYRTLKPRCIGLTNFIPRYETGVIIQRITKHNAILLSGEAGVGKSGIGISIHNEAKKQGMNVILFDVRRFSGVSSVRQITDHLRVEESLVEVITRLSRKQKCLLILDQLDSISESPLGMVIIELAIECKKLENIAVVVISRHGNIEKFLLRHLLEADFNEIVCRGLNNETVKTILNDYGVNQPSDKTISLGKNILLLDLICSIVKQAGSEGILNFEDGLAIWNSYIDTFIEKEHQDTHSNRDEILRELTSLAKNGLRSPERSFFLNDPPTFVQRRLISHGIISPVKQEGRKFSFSIDTMQDYLYARDATRRSLLKENVEMEISQFHNRNILLLMLEFYRKDNDQNYGILFEEVLSG